MVVLIVDQLGMVYVSDVRALVKLMAAMFVVSWMLVLLTSYGFPYRADPQQPTKQRHIVHVSKLTSFFMS